MTTEIFIRPARPTSIGGFHGSEENRKFIIRVVVVQFVSAQLFNRQSMKKCHSRKDVSSRLNLDAFTREYVFKQPTQRQAGKSPEVAAVLHFIRHDLRNAGNRNQHAPARLEDSVHAAYCAAHIINKHQSLSENHAVESVAGDSIARGQVTHDG